MALDRQEQMRMMFLQQTAADAPLSKAETIELKNLERLQNARVRPSVKVTPKSKAGNDARPSLSQRAKASGELINERRGDKVITQLRQEGGNAQQKAEALRDTVKRRVMDRKLSSLKQSDASIQLQGRDIVGDFNTVKTLEKAGMPANTITDESPSVRKIAGALQSETEGLIPGPIVIDESQGPNTKKSKYHLRKAGRKIEPFIRPDNKQPLVSYVGDSKIHNFPEVQVDARWAKSIRNRNGYGFELPPQSGEKASEVLTRNAAWLSGKPNLTVRNEVTPDNFINATSNNDWWDSYRNLTGVDFVDGRSGLGIDAEIEIRDGVSTKNSVQVAKRVEPNNKATNSRIKSVLQNRMKANNGNLEGALIELEDAGNISRNWGEGKAIKTDKQGNFTQDVIIKPSVTKAEADFNHNMHLHPSQRSEHLKDKVMMEPTSVKEINLDSVRSQMDNGLDPENIKVTGGGKNANTTGSTYGRVIHADLPDNNPAVTDLTKKGYTEQIIKNPDYKIQPQSPKKPKMTTMVASYKETPKIAGVITPDQAIKGARKVAKPFKGQLKVGAGAVLGDVAVGGVLSYATGESDNAQEAAWAGVTSLIPDSGAAGGKTIDIDGKLYNHDESTNMVYGMDGKVSGLAYKGGKPVAVPYGSLKGRTSMVDDVVTPIKSLATQIKETHQRRQAEKAQMNPTVGPPAPRPKTGKEWWKKGVESVMNYFQ